VDDSNELEDGTTPVRSVCVRWPPCTARRRCSGSDKAAQLRPGRAVVDMTVNLAVRGLLTPLPPLDAPAAGQEPPAGERDAGVEVNDVDQDDDGQDEDPEAVHELHDRLIEIRRALDDLGAVPSELAATRAGKRPSGSPTT